MLRKIVVAALLYIASFGVGALEFTDVYVDTSEIGWGIFVVQSDTFQFLAFFVYGQDGKPTWYSCQLTLDATGAGIYTGQLYASTGPYYGGPWDASQRTVAVGTCTFAPSDIYNATLTYSLTGGPTVVKPIQRFALTPYVFGGNYSGSMAGSISGCVNPGNDDAAFRGRYGLAVSQVGDTFATLIFTFVDQTHSGEVCTVAGPLNHLGRLYQLNGQLSCTGPGQGGGATAVTIDSLHPTGQGIEGHLTGSAGNGCTASLHFSAVQNVNN